MSLTNRHAVVAQATLTILVARDAAGSLLEGARTRIERVDGVAAVEDLDIHGVRPGLNDLTVEATAAIRLEPDPPGEGRRPTGRERLDPEEAAALLADGFGVKRAVVRRVAPAEQR